MLQDEDVKIYKADEALTPTLGEGERAAALFLRHKQSGNLAKCRELGQLLGTTFVDDARHLAALPHPQQRQVLLSFILSDELAGIIFDQVLQKSALGEFHKTVERLDQTLFATITDSAAYTLYILDDRQGCELCLGNTFAELCGQEGNQTLADEANTMARSYRKLYGDIISSYSFAPAEYVYTRQRAAP